LIEGAGGLFVPITRSYYMIDFIKELSIPVILASRAGLGTINHTLLSLEALQSRDVPIAGIILNQFSNPATTIEKDNNRVIEAYSTTPILAKINNANLEQSQTVTAHLKENNKLITILKK
jgi:dethiobiotin synthetase